MDHRHADRPLAPVTGSPAPAGAGDLPSWAEWQGWARSLGFSQIGISDIDLRESEPGFRAWLEAGFAGGMAYMQRHGLKRLRPAELVPGTVSVLTARMDYLPPAPAHAEGPGPAADWRAVEWARLDDPRAATVSLYARGRDYHKVVRQGLQRLAERIAQAVGPLGYRVFTDSAPVAEAALAVRSGLGWRGKHTLVLHREAGSMFFLGEIYLDRALPPTPATEDHCGQCTACLDACPTRAIVAPYRLDARRCIAYLTIEHDGPIPLALRPAVGNRIYGCDDCQLVCPWNKFARRSERPDFAVREALSGPTLMTLWGWSEADFLRHTEGSAIRRIGWRRWRRNLAVALGNALRHPAVRQEPQDQRAIRSALQAARADADPLVCEHIDWALAGSDPPAAPGATDMTATDATTR